MSPLNPSELEKLAQSLSESADRLLETVDEKSQELQLQQAEATHIKDTDVRPFVIHHALLVPPPSPAFKPAPTAPQPIFSPIEAQQTAPPTPTIQTHVESSPAAPSKISTTPITTPSPPKKIHSVTETFSTHTPVPDHSHIPVEDKAPLVQSQPSNPKNPSKLPDETAPNLTIKRGDESEKRYMERQEKLQDIINKPKGGTI
jgi:hypothetical protein